MLSEMKERALNKIEQYVPNIQARVIHEMGPRFPQWRELAENEAKQEKERPAPCNSKSDLAGDVSILQHCPSPGHQTRSWVAGAAFSRDPYVQTKDDPDTEKTFCIDWCESEYESENSV